MNRNMQEIRIFEGLGCACLVGFCASSIGSILACITYFQHRSMILTPVSELPSSLDQFVQVSSKVYPKDLENQVFYQKSETEKHFIGFANKTEERFFTEFYLDQDRKISVIPNIGTSFLGTTEEKVIKKDWKQALVALITLPLSVFKYFTGFSIKLGSVLTVKSLKTAQEVFVYGFCSRFLGRIEISPQFIASSKEDFLKVLKQEIGFKLLLPFAFLFGIFLCRARIRTLEKKEDRIEKIIASSDMICKKCARNQADIVLLPCNHLVLCSSCESEICPMCHKMIERRKKIFSG